MKRIKLDGKKMLTKEQAHKYIKNKLNLPYYYGNNLDALWDILNEINEMYLLIINKDYLYRNLNDYGEDIINVFKDYAQKNDKFILKIKN